MDSPPFTNSAMDGYAVRSDDLAELPATLTVTDDLPAGARPTQSVEPGTAQRIMTGAMLPDGADCVVPVELTDAGTTRVAVTEAVEAGQHIRRQGEDVVVGTGIGQAGQLLTPAVVAILVSLGVAEVSVTPAPRVAVISTGDELVESGSDLAEGQIFDSNSVLLEGLVSQAGAVCVTRASVNDEVENLRRVLTAASAEADLIVTAGGISAGAYEVVKQTLAESSGAWFGGVNIQPGKPQGFGLVNDVPVVTLPGNPVSVLVSFWLFVNPMLRRLAGAEMPVPERVSAQIADSVAAHPQRVRWQPAIRNGHSVVQPLPKGGSHMLSKAVGADCLIEVMPGESLPAGSHVNVLDFGIRP